MLAVLVCLGGCGGLGSPPDADLIKYAADAFEADVCGQVGELEFQAHLTAFAPSAAGERDVSLEFFAPETLRGVTVSRQAGVVSYKCGGQSFDFDGGGEGWLEIAELLCPRGSVTGVESEGLARVTLANGDRVLSVTIDPETGYPTQAEQISPRHISLQVISFGATVGDRVSGG